MGGGFALYCGKFELKGVLLMSHSRFLKEMVPVTLELNGIKLEPMGMQHKDDLHQVACDGELWNIRVTSVPSKDETEGYIASALEGQKLGHMLPFVVRNLETGKLIGTTRYHDIVPSVARLEIGYTWYAASYQRTRVNTTCKLMLLRHAFDVLGAQVVGWRTDNFNFRSQRAIERLGAKLDGVIRHHALRRDGSVRDTYMYSVSAGEWPEIEKHLVDMLKRA